MLRRLTVRDFVIVDETELEFEPGFTVLTGETGAGKSILIDALSLVLGERSESGVVRSGAKQAEISAEFEFDPAASALTAWLGDNALEGDPGVCLVRRVLDGGGRSRAYINGHASTIAQLRQVAELLLDIHGQHEHQSLLRGATQRELLDAYGESSELATKVNGAYQSWSERSTRYDTALRDADRLGKEREALGWQVSELEKLEFDLQSWADINAEHGRLTHASTLIVTASEALDALADSEQSSLRLLSAALVRLARASELDPGLREVSEILQSAQIELQEAVHVLERYRGKLEIDPVRLAEVEREIQAVHEACRKHRLRPEMLPSALDAARARLGELDLDLDLKRLERETNEARENYRRLAAELSQARRKAATKLGREVSAALSGLALAGAKFGVELEPIAEPSSHGQEKIEFRVATHAGAVPGPLGRVASGGELSRISLALQTVLSRVARVPTLVFDEVDAGIGGRVAEIVGQMLHRLSARHQVMCVTHLAQVAACADRHYRVSKVERGRVAASRVELLDGDDRVREVARMLGGARITATTLEHAAELVREARRPLSAS